MIHRCLSILGFLTTTQAARSTIEAICRLWVHSRVVLARWHVHNLIRVPKGSSCPIPHIFLDTRCLDWAAMDMSGSISASRLRVCIAFLSSQTYVLDTRLSSSPLFNLSTLNFICAASNLLHFTTDCGGKARIHSGARGVLSFFGGCASYYLLSYFYCLDLSIRCWPSCWVFGGAFYELIVSSFYLGLAHSSSCSCHLQIL